MVRRGGLHGRPEPGSDFRRSPLVPLRCLRPAAGTTDAAAGDILHFSPSLLRLRRVCRRGGGGECLLWRRIGCRGGGMSMGAKPTIAQNVGLLTAANLLMRGVSMLFQVYLTARVGAAGVGLLQLILSVNLFAVTLGTSGLRVAALYLSAEAYGPAPLRRRPAGHGLVPDGGAAAQRPGGRGDDGLRRAAGPLGGGRSAGRAQSAAAGADAAPLLSEHDPLGLLHSLRAGADPGGRGGGRQGRHGGPTMLLLQQGIAGDLAHACAAIVGGNALGGGGVRGGAAGPAAPLAGQAGRRRRHAGHGAAALGHRRARGSQRLSALGPGDPGAISDPLGSGPVRRGPTPRPWPTTA